MTTETGSELLHEFRRHPRRRSLLQGLLALGAGGASLLRFSEALAQASAAEVAQLTIFSQPGIVPDILRDATLPMARDRFPKTEIRFEIGSNAAGYPRMLAQRGNPVVSGGMFNDIFAQRGIADGMWTKFNPDFVPNATHVPQAIMTPGGFGIPFHLSPVGIMYNPDHVEEPKSWADLWDPKYRGRVSMWDAWYDGYIMAAVAAGEGPDLEAGIKAWAPHKANIGAWVNSPVAEADLVSRGEVWLAPHWGAWAAQAKAQGKKVAFTVPKEGGVQWAGHMQVCAGFSPAVTELTQRYLDTWLSDECQRAWIERGFFSPASTKIEIPEALRGNPAVMTASDAASRLVRPDYAALGPQMPRMTSLINRTLKG
ncbi:extracellular solute-binding protein [Roseomonas sp. E05]|uniref:ABC transporter substrate-binding protein n=1 Tax=Roseomonas sp. E05 TaxID=3046310 RepID=UPI0024B9E34A|nr:extracellular solute-binding protein [Roseomonas sp. E05]MDJ0388768.1 extracellular solute-binding protein [Roseomonas sp. E05]